MKKLLIAALLLSTPAFADGKDRYIECLVGKGAVALRNQPDDKKDAMEAQADAYAQCPSRPNVPDAELESLDEYVMAALESIAELWN